MAALLAADSVLASAPSLGITAPCPFQVVQRQGFEPKHAQVNEPGGPRLGFAEVPIAAEFAGIGGEAKLEFRVLTLAHAFGQGCGWTKLAGKIEGGQIAARARISAGGWYRLELRCSSPEGAATAAVEPFGVGEVFVIAGQSYAAGSNAELLKVEDPSGRVVAYDLTRKSWRVANDPLPHAGPRGTLWPALGNLLLPLVRVPVGFVDVAVGGTSSRQWLPGEKLYQNLSTAGTAMQRFRAVLWQQGESDVIEKTTAARYIKNLTTIHERLGKEWDFHPVWLLAKSTLHPAAYNNPDGEQVIRNAIDELWQHRGFFPGPDTDILGGENRSVLLSEGRHFTALGQRRAALMWFASVWELLNQGPDFASLHSHRID